MVLGNAPLWNQGEVGGIGVIGAPAGSSDMSMQGVLLCL